MEKFCYECGGLEDEKGPFIDGLCSECFSRENPLIKAPEELEISICNLCSAYYFDNSWHDVETGPAEEYLDAAEELVSSEIEVLQKDQAGTRYVTPEEAEDVELSFDSRFDSSERILVDVEVSARLEESQEEPLTDRTQVTIELSETTCDVCNKRKIGHYEAILQVRGEGEISDEKISKIFDELRDRALKAYERNREEFVSKAEEKHGGLDFYTSTPRLARKLGRYLKKEYGAKMGESSELVGQTEDGEEKHRVTVVTRLPE